MDAAKTVDEAKDSATVSYVLSASDFGFSDVDSGDTLQAVKITAVTTVGTLYLNGTAVADGDVISRADIDAGNLTFVPIDTDDSGSDEYAGDTSWDGTPVSPNGLGDQNVDYAKFDYQVSDGTNWSANTATMTIDINAVADTPTLSLSASSITAKETIDYSNVNNTHQGFTITALNPDGSTGSFATHTTNPTGFGVAGAASGADSETGYDDATNTYEQVVLTFDSPVDSVDVSLAWNAAGEDVAVAFYNNGTLIETVNTGGGSDGVDPAVNFSPSNGSLFDEIRFYPPNSGDDFLIHSISFDRTEITNDGTVVVKENSSAELGLNAALTDTDGSENLTLVLTDIPAGFTVTDGTNSFTADSTTTSVDVTNWNTGAITLKVPDVSSTYTYTINAVATSTEYSNGSTASITKSFDITVLESTPTAPTISTDQTVNVYEEGLPDGIVDAAGDPVTTVVTGQFNVADVNGDALNVTADVSGSFTSNGVAISWNWDETTQTLLGSAGSKDVMKVVIDDAGAYTATLLGPIDHSSSGEDTLTVPVTVTVSDGDTNTSDATATLNVVVGDDSPETSDVSQQIVLPSVDTNIQLVLDFSGSMNDYVIDDGNGGTTNALAIMKTAVNDMLGKYDNLGDVKVSIVTFSSSAATITDSSGNTWMSVADAISYINGLQDSDMSGATYYDTALNQVQTTYDDPGKIAGAQNVSYFLTDGAPTSGHEIDTEEPGWISFVDNRDINSFAYAIGTGASVSNINPIAYDGVTPQNTDGVQVANPNDLPPVLRDSVIGASDGDVIKSGIGGNVGFGADGGDIYEVSLDGVTYTYDAANNSVSASDGSTPNYDSATHELTVDTNLNGTFVMNLDTGTYSYTASGDQTSKETETITFNVKDNDDDVSNTSTLTIDVYPPGTPYVTPTDDSVIQDTPQSIGYVTDDDAADLGQTLSITSSSASHGSVALDTNNNIIYTPDNGYFGTDTVTVTVSDGSSSSTKTFDVTVINANDNADLPQLNMSITDQSVVYFDTFDTGLGDWTGSNISSDSNQMLIDGGGDYGINNVTYDFGNQFAGQRVTVQFSTNILASSNTWESNDSMGVYVDIGDGNGYQQIYSQSGPSNIDGVTHTISAQLDTTGKLNIGVLNNSSWDGEDLWVDDFSVTLSKYQIDLTPSLNDQDNGGEVLKDLIIKDLPSNVVRVEDSAGNVLTANADGTYTVTAAPADGTPQTVYVYTSAALSQSQIDAVHARVTAEETASGDTATVEVDAAGTAQIIDGIVEGLYYETTSGLTGYTDADGYFDYADGDVVTFKIGDVSIGQIDTASIDDGKVFLQDVAGVDRTDMNDEYVENMAVLLQSLDSDSSDNIVITEAMHEAFSDESFDLATISEADLASIIEANGAQAVSEEAAMEHVGKMLEAYDGVEEGTLEVHVADSLVGQSGFNFDSLGGMMHETQTGDMASNGLSVRIEELFDMAGEKNPFAAILDGEAGEAAPATGVEAWLAAGTTHFSSHAMSVLQNNEDGSMTFYTEHTVQTTVI